jgi:anti-anti-sigma factor
MAQIATPPPRPPLVWVTPPTGASDTTVIWLRGEHDLSTVDMLSEALASATTDVTIDLSGVDFMDSTTLMAILRAASSDAQGKAATLRNPSPSARRLLDICGLNELLKPTPGDPGMPPSTVQP